MGVAVSGGPDSLALLLLAHAAMPGRIETASVDHGLRRESAGEARFVAQVCDALAVPYSTLTVAVPSGNVQAEAREARYAALAGWAKERKLAAVATAHHADDQAETLLMRLNRGSGLAGLAGVRPVAELHGMTVVRPLLKWRKAELEAVVAAAGLSPVRDPSNSDERYDRARLRKAMAALDLDIASMARSAELLGEAHETLTAQAQDRFERTARRVSGGIDLEAGHTDYLAVECVRLCFKELGVAAPRSAVASVVDRLTRGENASHGGILVRSENGLWRFRSEPPRTARKTR